MKLLRVRSALTLSAAVAAVALPAAPATAHTTGTGRPTPAPGVTCADAAESVHLAQRLASELRTLRGARFEQTFIAAIIPHHQAAIEMARLELAKGSRPPAKRLATEIIEAQQREIRQLTAWLRDWYGLTPDQARQAASPRAREVMAQMDRHSAEMIQMLRALPAGGGFDRAFMQAMIPHHTAAIIEARTVPGRATHKELVSLANMMVRDQLREIAQMRTWLARWYDAPVCDRP
jgi:uncharacterized protein (DUF305 family)